jgi:hypothetical protein
MELAEDSADVDIRERVYGATATFGKSQIGQDETGLNHGWIRMGSTTVSP